MNLYLDDEREAEQEAAYHQDMLNREREAESALDEALKAGVSREALKVLARETGCVAWAMRQSLKERNV